MSAENKPQYTEVSRPTPEEQEPTVKDVVNRTLKHWPWLLFSIIVCTGLGVLIVLTTPKKYNETAQVVIKNDSEGGSTAISSSISNLGLFSNNSNVKNEIATMASPDIMLEVVKMLDLTVDYYEKGTFHKKALYGNNLPVQATFPDLEDFRSIRFNVTIKPNGDFTIFKLKKYIPDSNSWEKIAGEFKGKLGVPVKTPVGTIFLSPTTRYVAGKENLELSIVKKSLANTVNSYTKKLDIELDDDDSTVIDLTINDENRQRADEILAAVIAVYNESWINEKNQNSIQTSKFINERLGVIENELGRVDSDISDYKSANMVPDIRTMTESYVKETQELTQQIVQLEGQLQSVNNLRRHLSTAGLEGNALPANTSLENAALQSQINDYNELLLKRNTLESKASDKNPVVQNLDEELRQMRGAIMSSVDNAVQGLESRLGSLRTAQSNTTSKLSAAPVQAKHLLSVERQQMVKENLYLFLLQRREDNELNQAFTAYNTRIIKKPGGDGSPTAPKTGFIIFTSFLFGLFIPFGWNFLIEKWDNKIRSRDDLKHVKTPMIGEIPLLKKIVKKGKKADRPQMLIKSGNRDVINEAFRVLRTNIDFTRIHKDGCNVISFTSFNPGSGKSFISMNLAASMALKGKKILVIDGDFRRGSTSSYVGSPRKGLTSYLAGHQNDVKGMIVQYPDMENLYVLPSGNVPPNPTELLETPEFSELVEDLKKDYDYIFIDCPPIGIVADASIINLVSDRTIFVVRAGLLNKTDVNELDKLYSEKDYNNMAFILNGTTFEMSAYGKYASNGKYTYGN